VANGEFVFFDYEPVHKLNAALAKVNQHQLPDFWEWIQVEIHISQSSFLWRDASVFYVHKMSPFVGRFDQFVARSNSAGLDLIWEEKALITLRKKFHKRHLEVEKVDTNYVDDDDTDEAAARVTLEHLTVVFAFLGPGFILALITLSFELKMKNKEKRFTDFGIQRL